MSEDELLEAVLTLAKLLRWRRYHVRNSRAGIIQGDIGFPDLVLVRAPRVIFAELKDGKGRLGPTQAAWLADLLECPAVGVYLWRPKDWLDGTIDKVLR